MSLDLSKSKLKLIRCDRTSTENVAAPTETAKWGKSTHYKAWAKSTGTEKSLLSFKRLILQSSASGKQHSGYILSEAKAVQLVYNANKTPNALMFS